MKRKIMIWGSFVLLSTSFLFGCNKKTHQHRLEEKYEWTDTYHFKKCLDCEEIVEKEDHHLTLKEEAYACDICGYSFSYTQEDLFLRWKEGRDDAANYEGAYTLQSEAIGYVDESLSYKTEQEEGRDGNQYYSSRKEYDADENGKWIENQSTLVAVKKVIVDGKEKTKYYEESFDEEGTQKEGSYVSPDYVEKYMELEFNEFLTYYYIESGDTYLDFLKNVKQNFLENYEKEPMKLEFIFNLDGSVSFNMEIEGEEVNPYIEEENYEKTTYHNQYSITVKEGKIISCEDQEMSIYVYSDKEEKYDERTQKTYTYAFNQEKYEGISVETDTTDNYYYSSVNFIIEGYPLRYSDEAYVDEVYSAKKAATYLDDLIAFLISSSDESYADCFTFYLDENYQTPFEEQYIEDEEELTLYVKFKMPSHLAVVICVFQNAERSWLYLAYIQEVGTTFDIDYAYSEYKILTIDGQEWKDGDAREIPCEENRAYIIVFDTPNLLG